MKGHQVLHAVKNPIRTTNVIQAIPEGVRPRKPDASGNAWIHKLAAVNRRVLPGR